MLVPCICIFLGFLPFCSSVHLHHSETGSRCCFSSLSSFNSFWSFSRDLENEILIQSRIQNTAQQIIISAMETKSQGDCWKKSSPMNILAFTSRLLSESWMEHDMLPEFFLTVRNVSTSNRPCMFLITFESEGKSFPSEPFHLTMGWDNQPEDWQCSWMPPSTYLITEMRGVKVISMSDTSSSQVASSS